MSTKVIQPTHLHVRVSFYLLHLPLTARRFSSHSLQPIMSASGSTCEDVMDTAPFFPSRDHVQRLILQGIATAVNAC